MLKMWVLPILFVFITSIPLSIAGFFISSRRMGFYVDAISHSAMSLFTMLTFLWFAWIQGGLEWGIWFAILGAGLAGALMSFRLFHDFNNKEPWMGEIFVLTLSLAALFMSKMPLRGIDFEGLFLGQLLLLTPLDFQISVVICAVLAFSYVVWGSRWHLFFLDRYLFRQYYGSRSLGIFWLFFLISILIAFLVQSVGFILSFAWLIFPCRFVHQRIASIWGTLIVSILLINGMAWVGFGVSYIVDIPVGPTCAILWVILEVGVNVFPKPDFSKLLKT